MRRAGEPFHAGRVAGKALDEIHMNEDEFLGAPRRLDERRKRVQVAAEEEDDLNGRKERAGELSGRANGRDDWGLGESRGNVGHEMNSLFGAEWVAGF